MTSRELRQLRMSYAGGSARKLAKRLGCHPSTIWRNERRRFMVTQWLFQRFIQRPDALGHWLGLINGAAMREGDTK